MKRAFYTSSEREQMAALWAGGASVPAIALRLCRPADGIEDYIRRHRDLFPRRHARTRICRGTVRQISADRAAYLATAEKVASATGVPVDAFLVWNRRHTSARGTAKLARFAAIYLTVTLCGVNASRLSRACGLHRAAIGRILATMEDLRDRADFEALMTKLEAKVGV